MQYHCNILTNQSVYCLCRWVWFRENINEIEKAMKKLTSGIPVSYRQEIGGGYFVSVTSGFYCVGIRKFFIPHGETEMRAKRQGLAVRLREWSNLKTIMAAIDDAHPTLATSVLCYQRDDHMNQLGALQCSECNPFRREVW